MTPKEYDVLIVGSGHSGGMAANILTKQGFSCLMLNAGPESDFEHNRVNKAVHELPYRGFGKPGGSRTFSRRMSSTRTSGRRKRNSLHTRSRQSVQLGARAPGRRASLFWARQSFRLSDFEFRRATWRAPARTGQ